MGDIWDSDHKVQLTYTVARVFLSTFFLIPRANSRPCERGVCMALCVLSWLTGGPRCIITITLELLSFHFLHPD